MNRAELLNFLIKQSDSIHADLDENNELMELSQSYKEKPDLMMIRYSILGQIELLETITNFVTKEDD